MGKFPDSIKRLIERFEHQADQLRSPDYNETCWGKRYVRNPDKKEVHDLDKETKNCQIDEIKNPKCFDTLSEAKADGSDNCHWCLGDSTR